MRPSRAAPGSPPSVQQDRRGERENGLGAPPPAAEPSEGDSLTIPQMYHRPSPRERRQAGPKSRGRLRGNARPGRANRPRADGAGPFVPPGRARRSYCPLGGRGLGDRNPNPPGPLLPALLPVGLPLLPVGLLGLLGLGLARLRFSRRVHRLGRRALPLDGLPVRHALAMGYHFHTSWAGSAKVTLGTKVLASEAAFLSRSSASRSPPRSLAQGPLVLLGVEARHTLPCRGPGRDVDHGLAHLGVLPAVAVAWTSKSPRSGSRTPAAPPRPGSTARPGRCRPRSGRRRRGSRGRG